MVRTMYSPTYIVKSAQNMRKRMTTAEGMLWQKLSTGFGCLRFRRQYPIGNHVVDFYCRKLKLIVEISRSGIPVQKERDAFLCACGYTVLRFSEKEIVDDIPRIVSAIGLRVRLIGWKLKLASVNGIIRHSIETARLLFSPRRRFCAGTDHRLKLLLEF
jgi:very-short-patch-repair endonuclease